MIERIRTAVKTVFRKRSRSWLTVVGIAVGVMMVAVVAVLGNAGREVIDGELQSMGVDGLSVTAAQTAPQLNDEALAAIRGLSCVSSAMPLMLTYTDVSLRSQVQHSVLCGIDAGAGQVISVTVKHGRMITHGDVAAAARVCVLDEAVAEKAYGRSNIVGKTVQVQTAQGPATLTVVGVTETGSSLLQNLTAYIPGMVYIPYTTHRELTGQTAFDQIAVRTAGSADTARHRIQQTLTRLYGGRVTFRTDDLAAQKERLSTVVDVVAVVLAALSGISLLVSGIGIMTIMLSSVSERTREIGIKKAIGATQGRILAEFLTESVILSACGGLLGLIPAVALAVLLMVAGVSTAIPLGWFAALFRFSLLVGGLFGVYPAFKASRLPPVEALRSE